MLNKIKKLSIFPFRKVSLTFKITLWYTTFIVLLIGFMLIYYHPNKVYVFLTYLAFVIYNTLLWMNMIRMRAINKENNKKSNKKK